MVDHVDNIGAVHSAGAVHIARQTVASGRSTRLEHKIYKKYDV
jgi:hypothetical protein